MFSQKAGLPITFFSTVCRNATSAGEMANERFFSTVVCRSLRNKDALWERCSSGAGNHDDLCESSGPFPPCCCAGKQTAHDPSARLVSARNVSQLGDARHLELIWLESPSYLAAWAGVELLMGGLRYEPTGRINRIAAALRPGYA
jgi:hypothetical protein